ncbi:hypothetical protein ElyMa_003127600 [Elysia marginata]|uniref:GH18 domain-containing protein n=1 Tax=Elysia marginata TaxID=1093978 RepID=A0AAV4IR80_9GAST|nr:hypothetical protein ElyMa_003127600 [Elysia marginata]
MGRFRGKRKHPKLLQRLFWRWIVISTFLCMRSVNCEQSIALNSSQDSLPTNNVSDFPLHQSDSDTASTEDYNTSSSSTGRPNESVLQSVLPPVQFNMVRGSDALSHTDISERVAESNSPYLAPNRNFRFSMLASITSAASLTLRPSPDLQSINWDTVECTVSTQNLGNGKCRKSKCDEQFKKRPDGECRRLIKIVIAIGGGGCSFMRSKETERKLLSVVKCYLEAYKNAEVDTETIRFSTVIDERTNRSLVQMSALIYFPYFYTLPFQDAILSELLLLIHGADFCCDPNPSPVECAGQSCQIGDLEAPRIRTMDNKAYLKQVKSWEAIGNRTAILCGAIASATLSERMIPRQCLQGPVYVPQLDFFQQAANVPCFMKNVNKHAIQGKQYRLCNSCRGNRNVTENWFIFLLIASVVVSTKR